MRQQIQLDEPRLTPIHTYLAKTEAERLQAARRALEERWGQRVSISALVRKAVLRAVSELERAQVPK